MVTRRDHLRAWAVEVVKEGFQRGQLMRDFSPDMILKWVLAQAAIELKEDLRSVVRDIGLGLAEVGLRSAERAAGQLLGDVFGAIGERLKTGRKG